MTSQTCLRARWVPSGYTFYFYVNIFVCHDDRSVLEVSDFLLVLWWVFFILSTALVTGS